MATSPPITDVPDKPAHDRLLADSLHRPTVLYLSSSVLPACKAFTPTYEALAARHQAAGSRVRFAQMEYSSQTSALCKFAQAQLPVVVFMCADRWCRTLLGPTGKEVAAGVEELMRMAEELGCGRDGGEGAEDGV